MSSNASSANHGLAASIRAATESETFDLAGQSVSTITNTIQSAFAEPFPPLGDSDRNSNDDDDDDDDDSKMIRLTFITGAGKHGRQKYDEGASKAVTSTLNALGFVEDRAASCIVECAGSYKLQHDTGKNLKTVVVFPNISNHSSNNGIGIGIGSSTTGNHSNNSNNNSNRNQIPKLLDESSPEHMIATASLPVFQRMLASKCPSWTQKRHCMAAVERLQATVRRLDETLIRGTPLAPAEQDFYDTVTALEDKEALIKREMHSQVSEEGDLTQGELEALLQHNAERVAAVRSERGSGSSAALEKLLQRKELLKSIQPRDPHPLRLEASIRKLRKELQPLLDEVGGDDSSSRRLKTVRETQLLARKEELEQEVRDLELKSRGWFEEDDAFHRRVQQSRDAYARTVPQKKGGRKKASYASAVGTKSNSTTTTTTTTTVNKWVLPGDMKKGVWESSGTAKKKKNKQGGAVFSAMMIDSDDEEDEEEAEGSNVTSRASESMGHQESEQAESAKTTTATPSVGNKNSKKKKKGKAGGTGVAGKQKSGEDAALNRAVAEQAAAARKAKEEEAARKALAHHPATNFFLDYILPALVAVLTWFATLLVGKPKRRGGNQKRD